MTTNITMDAVEIAEEIISRGIVDEFRRAIAFLNSLEKKNLFGSVYAVKADQNQIVFFNEMMKTISNDLLFNVRDHYDGDVYVIDNINNIIEIVNKIDKNISGKLSFPDMIYDDNINDFSVGWKFSMFNRKNLSEKIDFYAIPSSSVEEVKEEEVSSLLPFLMADALKKSAQTNTNPFGTFISSFPCKFCIGNYRISIEPLYLSKEDHAIKDCIDEARKSHRGFTEAAKEASEYIIQNIFNA